MKGGNEDDKVMRPMFPRLHVNDTEKGGPRAPPRNKMALYEQLSIPSQKFNSTSLPNHKPSTLAPSASLTQDGSDRKTMNSQFYLFQTVPTPNIEKTHSRSFDVKNLETRNLEPEGRLSGRMDNKSSHVAISDAQANSLNEDELSKRNNSFKAKYDDGDDFRVPTFVQSEANPCSKNTIVEVSMRDPSSASNIQKSYSATPNSPHQVSSPSGMPICKASASDILSKRHEGNHVEHMPEEVIVHKEHRKKNSTNLEDAGMLPGPSASDILSKRHVGNHVEHMPREVVRKEHRKQNSTNLEDAGMLPGPSKLFLATSGGVTEANTSLLEKLGHQNTRIDTKTCQGRARELESLNNQDFLENRKTSKLRPNMCSGTSLANSHGSHDYKENVSGELRDADRSDIVSEDSMVDSISVLEISPDDVVGVIGPKQFWKARRAIVNQQRVFAIQVFELHRLIKVQKLFAASPHLLLEDTGTVKIQSKVANKCPNVASNNFQPIAQQKHGFSEKPNHNDDRPLEKAANPFPLQTQQERGPNQELGQLPVYVPHSGNLPTVPSALDNRQNPWCFHPPANQWLIPVMSPSEGLVYKPYSGPCPPPTGFMAPLYGSCGQLGLTTAAGAGDLLNTTNSVPASNQQQNMGVLPGSPAMGPSYFSSPYGMAMVNPVNSTSAVEQFSPFCRARPNGGKTLHSRGSRNMSFTRSDAFSGCPQKHNNASKDSELQASTASSPCDGPQGEGKDVLPLFPMAPAGERSCQPSLSGGREQQSNVIKVVPHNGRSATESAARIFRSIQEERQQLDM